MDSKKIRLRANHFESLIWGLNNFDGIETDLRLNADDELVLYHDTKHGRRSVREMSSDECRNENIVIFKDFLSHPEVIDAKKAGKTFIFEPKPDCEWYRDVSQPDYFRKIFLQTIDDHNFSIDNNLHLMSFSEAMLKPFIEDGINVYPIYPLANFCVYKNRWSLLLLKPLSFYFKHSPKSLLRYTKDRGYTGALMSFPYFYGLNKLFRESRVDIIEYAIELDLAIIANLYFPKLERKYDDMILLTDNTRIYPNYSSNNGKIIAHRGCGANDVKIPISEYKELQSLVYI